MLYNILCEHFLSHLVTSDLLAFSGLLTDSTRLCLLCWDDPDICLTSHWLTSATQDLSCLGLSGPRYGIKGIKTTNILSLNWPHYVNYNCPREDGFVTLRKCAIFIDPLWNETRGPESVHFGYKYSVWGPIIHQIYPAWRRKTVSEMLDTNSIFTRIIAPKDIITNTLIYASYF
jgi:hypothetical protein